jgi:hypothetical protein
MCIPLAKLAPAERSDIRAAEQVDPVIPERAIDGGNRLHIHREELNPAGFDKPLGSEDDSSSESQISVGNQSASGHCQVAGLARVPLVAHGGEAHMLVVVIAVSAWV